MADSKSDLESDTDTITEFSVENVNLIFDEISDTFEHILKLSQVTSLKDLGQDAIKKMSKENMSMWLDQTCDTLRKSRDLLKSAGKKVDNLHFDVSASQKTVTKLQDELIKCKNVQLKTVEATVKAEF